MSKKKILILLSALFVFDLIVIFLVTPFISLPKLHFQSDQKPLPNFSELKTYNLEAPIDKEWVKVKAEKRFIKAYEHPKWSICYVHGFTASPMELEPVVSDLAKKLQANLVFARLRGHGLKDPEGMKNVWPQAWINDTLDCIDLARKNGERLLLMGTSFGASLATLAQMHFSQHEPDKAADALVLVSPNFGIQNKFSFILAGVLGEEIARGMFGSHREFEPVNDQHAFYWTTKHPVEAVKPFAQITMILQKQKFSDLKAPVFIAYSEQDEVLDVSKIKDFYKEVGAQEKTLLTDPNFDQHVLAGDIVNSKGNSILLSNILKFIEGLP